MTDLERLHEINRELLAALVLAEKAIDDCHAYRRHLHYTELEAVRAAITKARGEPSP
jgi:hypothetical protein